MDTSAIYVGFDGGGSTSRFLIQQKHDEPKLFTYPLSLKYTDLGIDESARGFSECLRENLGADVMNIRAMCISLSGASNESMNKEFALAFRKEIGLTNLKLHIESDSSFTLETVYPGDRSGILLIAGTGSVAIAKTKSGEIIKVGGWGRMLGDEGSGYWIGMQALKHFCKAMDGTDERDDLFAVMGENLNNELGNDLSLLRSKLYREEIMPQYFAPLVFESLPRDSAAENILLEAAVELTVAIQSLWEKVGDDCDRVVTLHGGIARQPFIGFNIAANCDSPGFKFELLDENVPLERALEISHKLDIVN